MSNGTKCVSLEAWNELNTKFETELTAAREVADKYRGYWESFGAERLKLKGEITAVTKQRDEAREELRQVLQRLTQPTKP